MDTDSEGPGRAAGADAPGRFEARVRERLCASAESLDGRTRSRLTQARHAALAELVRPAPRAFRVPGAWLPAGSVAAAAVLVALAWFGQPGRGGFAPVAAEVGAPEDIEILASKDGTELYAEDAEFYEWAGTAADVADAARG